MTHAALACTHALSGNHDQAETCRLEASARTRGTARRERQHGEILSAILEEHIARALGLAFEHIAEFGPDPLIIKMLGGRVAKRQDPALSAEFAALAAQNDTPNRN